jgi:hypothetical protein
MLTVLSMLLCASPTMAQVLPFYWDRIDVDLAIQANGELWVTETQTYAFQRAYTNQRYRYISLDKVDKIDNISITEKGKPLAFEQETRGNKGWIRWRHGLNPPEHHTFILKYHVIGGLRQDDQNTQLHWETLFGNRQAPILNSTVKVHLPNELANKVTSFQSFGTSNVVQTQLDDRTISFRMTREVSAGEKLEVQVVFPSGILNLPKVNQESDHTAPSIMFSIIICIILFSILLILLLSIIILPIALILTATIKASEFLSRRCPKCKKFKLKRSIEILQHSTIIAIVHTVYTKIIYLVSSP